MKALIIADSLSMPRQEIPYEDTWPAIVRFARADIHWIQRSQRALNSNSLVGAVKEDFLEHYLPEVVVLQVGIVDCAPRLFSADSMVPKILNRLPGGLRKASWSWVKARKQRSAANAEVSFERFQANLRKYANRCMDVGVSRLFVIEIAEPVGEMLQKNPAIVEQVKSYNKAIHDLHKEFTMVTIVSINEFNRENDGFFAPDGYHLARSGAMALATSLLRNLPQ